MQRGPRYFHLPGSYAVQVPGGTKMHTMRFTPPQPPRIHACTRLYFDSRRGRSCGTIAVPCFVVTDICGKPPLWTLCAKAQLSTEAGASAQRIGSSTAETKIRSRRLCSEPDESAQGTGKSERVETQQCGLARAPPISDRNPRTRRAVRSTQISGAEAGRFGGNAPRLGPRIASSQARCRGEQRVSR